MDKLTQAEIKRYSRHLVLQNFGEAAQLKLKKARVLVVGAGGLGCPALLYLTAAGVGKIGIVDFDDVDESNLQRQVLFSNADIGKNKSETARLHLQGSNPYIEIKSYPVKLTTSNCLGILSEFDIVLDGSDNFPTRYLVNDACVLNNKPLVYGSVLQFEGQVAVFNVQINNTWSSNYRDLFPQPPLHNEIPNCEQAGVLGVLPGIIGTMMAGEAIKLITGVGQPLINQLLLFESLNLETTRINVPNRNSRLHIHGLIDYDHFCGTNHKPPMKEINVSELKELIESKADFQLIDVREIHEYESANIGGEHIPMSDVPHNLDRINREIKVVIHCRSGGRSGNIIQWLEKNHGYNNLYNLKGGITAWANEIDSSLDIF